MLNARRHRRGNQQTTHGFLARSPLVLNARRHRRGNQIADPRCQRGEGSVLNARRHRRGNQATRVHWFPLPQKCSTPEGIGGGIRTRITRWHRETVERCSTPEGIGGGIRRLGRQVCRQSSNCAQRPKASEGESGINSATIPGSGTCSTPEGIGGGISWDGIAALLALATCSTPEGIGGGISLTEKERQGYARSAQRPKASEGESGLQ